MCLTWLLATRYNTVEQKPEWLALAKHGIDFIQKYGFDDDGRLFFLINHEGKPIRKRRYVFTETFAAIAFVAYSKAADDSEAAEQAGSLFELITRYATTPGLIPPKFTVETRPLKSIGLPMILLATTQLLREIFADPIYDKWIDRCILEIRNDFMNFDFEAGMETVGPHGEFIDHFDGRTLNPAHAIECTWFIRHEAKHRGNDPDLIKMGATMLDWMWKRSWDEKYGGIFHFRDVMGLPVQEYW